MSENVLKEMEVPSFTNSNLRSTSPQPRLVKRSLSFTARNYFVELRKKREVYERERANLSIYTSPKKVLSYFLLFTFYKVVDLCQYVSQRLYLLFSLLTLIISVAVAYKFEGPHQPFLFKYYEVIKFYGYWLVLGIASSVGLGTGLHTFVLFLGPHVAEITLAAYQCNSINFAVRGLDRLSCSGNSAATTVTPVMILLKVLPQSVIWGFGTALGELPPYFMARAAAYAGKGDEELESLSKLDKTEAKKLSWKQYFTLSIYQLLQRTGFLGIFICASIPNPLFDLAGIMCGHFLIPFSTFFSAVVLGKALVKASLQVFLVIILMSKSTINRILTFVQPRSQLLYKLIDKFVQDQALAIRVGSVPDPSSNTSLTTNFIPLIWNGTIALMLLYFLFSIIESLAQTYLQTTQKEELDKLKRLQLRHARTKSVHF